MESCILKRGMSGRAQGLFEIGASLARLQEKHNDERRGPAIEIDGSQDA